MYIRSISFKLLSHFADMVATLADMESATVLAHCLPITLILIAVFPPTTWLWDVVCSSLKRPALLWRYSASSSPASNGEAMVSVLWLE